MIYIQTAYLTLSDPTGFFEDVVLRKSFTYLLTFLLKVVSNLPSSTSAYLQVRNSFIMQTRYNWYKSTRI